MRVLTRLAISMTFVMGLWAAAAVPASAHRASMDVQWLPVYPGYPEQTTSAWIDHETHVVRIETHFGQVTNNSAFIRYVDIHYDWVQSTGIFGGEFVIFSGGSTFYTEADSGTNYYYPSTYRVWVNRWFVGGLPGMEKRNVDACWDDCSVHASYVGFYAPSGGGGGGGPPDQIMSGDDQS
jgi:hypothetical protein